MSQYTVLIGARSEQGPFRSANEDAYWVVDAQTPTELGTLCIVADGVGGQEHGAAAAQQAVQVAQTSFYQKRRSGWEIPAALSEAILYANQAVYEQAQARGGARMGCTLVAAVLHKEQLYIVHVGDARAYLLQADRLQQLTRDDTWVQKQVDAGIITTEEAEKHELRNVVTQVLGNKLDITVHQSEPYNLYKGDKVLLCSDGLHGVLRDEQLYALMVRNSPQNAADALVQAAIEAETKDNITAVIINSSSSMAGKGTMSRAGGLPAWAIATLGTAFLLLVGLLVMSFWPSDNVTIDFIGGREATTEPVATAVPPTANPPTAVPPTPLPTPTSSTTITTPSATATQLSPSPPTPTLTASPEAPLMGCVTVAETLYVWQDNQVYSNTCDHFAREDLILPDGAQVRILDNNAILVNGPDSSCISNQFIKIQSVTDPEIEGWVMQNNIRTLPAGETCQ